MSNSPYFKRFTLFDETKQSISTDKTSIMTKPIFIIRYPLSIAGHDTVGISKINVTMQNKFPDYSTLAVPVSGKDDDWKFEVLNVKDMYAIDFEMLKKKVLDAVEELKLSKSSET